MRVGIENTGDVFRASNRARQFDEGAEERLAKRKWERIKIDGKICRNEVSTTVIATGMANAHERSNTTSTTRTKRTARVLRHSSELIPTKTIIRLGMRLRNHDECIWSVLLEVLMAKDPSCVALFTRRTTKYRLNLGASILS